MSRQRQHSYEVVVNRGSDATVEKKLKAECNNSVSVTIIPTSLSCRGYRRK